MKTANTLLAFHGDPGIKETYLSCVIQHRQAGDIIQGIKCWDGKRGSAVGCTIHSTEIDDYEAQLGFPKVFAYLENHIFFRGLPPEKALHWPETFLSAISPGADLSKIPLEFMASFLDGSRVVIHSVKTSSALSCISDIVNLLLKNCPNKKEWSTLIGLTDNEANKAIKIRRARAEARAIRAAWRVALAAESALNVAEMRAQVKAEEFVGDRDATDVARAARIINGIEERGAIREVALAMDRAAEVSALVALEAAGTPWTEGGEEMLPQDILSNAYLQLSEELCDLLRAAPVSSS